MGISREEALSFLRSDDLLGMGMEADALRRRMHPEGVVTYQCVHEMAAAEGDAKIPDGASALRLLCRDPADLQVVESIAAKARERGADVWFEVCFSGGAFVDSSSAARIGDLAACGIDSVGMDVSEAGGDYAANAAAMLEVHRAAHASGMRTVAAMPFGGGESYAERLDLLDAVRKLQEESRGFTALAPVAIAPASGRELDGVTAVERLKMLALCRMYVDNIEHVRSSQVGAGLKVLQTGFLFGANDAELVEPQAGTTEQDLRRVIRDAGLRPAERNGGYTTVFLA